MLFEVRFKILTNVVFLDPSQGIIHRDIKPQNILLSAPIEDPVSVAKIADFGAAVFTFGIGKDKVSYGGTPHFQVRSRRPVLVV